MKSIIIFIFCLSLASSQVFGQNYYYYEKYRNNYQGIESEMPISYYFMFGNYMLFGNNVKQKIIDKKIKSVTDITTKEKHNSSEIRQISKSEHIFDTKGNLLKFVAYNRHGNVSRTEEYQYNEFNKTTMAVFLNSKNEQRYKDVYTYNNDGYLADYVHYNKKGKIKRKQSSVYGDGHHKTELITYKPGGTEIRSRYTYKFEDGKLAETVRYNSKGKIKHKWVYDCNPVGELVSNMKDTSRICKRIESDSLGNTLKIDVVTFGKNKTRKNISTFDKSNHLIEFLTTNPEGETITREKYEYDKLNHLIKYTEFRRKNKGARNINTYTYENNQLNSSEYCGKKKCIKYEYSYDGNQNLTILKYSNSKNRTYTTSYLYEFL